MFCLFAWWWWLTWLGQLFVCSFVDSLLEFDLHDGSHLTLPLAIMTTTATRWMMKCVCDSIGFTVHSLADGNWLHPSRSYWSREQANERNKSSCEIRSFAWSWFSRQFSQLRPSLNDAWMVQVVYIVKIRKETRLTRHDAAADGGCVNRNWHEIDTRDRTKQAMLSSANWYPGRKG